MTIGDDGVPRFTEGEELVFEKQRAIAAILAHLDHMEELLERLDAIIPLDSFSEKTDFVRKPQNIAE